MASDLNRVLLIGRMTRDPELRQTNGGTSICRFGIANNRNYKQGDERREEVSFFNCVAWGRQAEIINQYCQKGKQVAIEGRLKQNSWEDKDGKKQSSVDVVVDSLQMLGGPKEEGQAVGGERYAPPPVSGGPNATPETGGGLSTGHETYGDGGHTAFDDDPDIPF